MMKKVNLKRLALSMKQFSDEMSPLSHLTVAEVSEIVDLYHRVVRTFLLNGYQVGIHGYGLYQLLFRKERQYSTLFGKGKVPQRFVIDFAFSKVFQNKLSLFVEEDYFKWLERNGEKDDESCRLKYLNRLEDEQLVLL